MCQRFQIYNIFETQVLRVPMKIHRQTSSAGGEQLSLRRRWRFIGLYLEYRYDEDHAELGRSLAYHLHEAGSQPRTRQQLDVRHQYARCVRDRSRYIPGDVDGICHSPLPSLCLGLPPLEIGGGAITLNATDRAQSGRSTGRKHQVNGNLRSSSY